VKVRMQKLELRTTGFGVQELWNPVDCRGRLSLSRNDKGGFIASITASATTSCAWARGLLTPTRFIRGSASRAG
jgi:hypothetical protein